MSGQMWGADIEELERIAKEFRKSADDIDGQGNALTGTLNRVAWLGEIATTFVQDWTGVCVPKIGMSTSFLRDAATNLEKQARQQREASDTLAGGGASGKSGRSLKELAEDSVRLAQEAREQAGNSPAEQLAWWNSLTERERAALLKGAPGLLMGMDGLPPDVKTLATEQYCADAAGKIVVSTDHYEIGGSVNVPLLGTEIGVGGQLTADKTVYADGSADVQLSGAGLASTGTIGSAAGAGPMGTVTYHFDSQAEADAFLERVAVATGVGAVIPIIGGPSLQAVLLAESDHLQSGGAGLTGGANANYGPASGSISGSVVGTVDRNGNQTLTATGSMSVKHASAVDIVAARAAGPVGSAEMLGTQDVAAASSSASVTFGSDMKPKTLTLTTTTMTGESTGLHGVEYGTQTNGSGTTTTIELDLNDPVVAAHASDIADAVQRGDVDSVKEQLGQIGASDVVDRATVTTTTFDTSSTEGGFDVYVATGNGEMSGTTTTSATIKPPGGEAQVVMGG